ncbi:hypothetical protein Zmor_016455 [Zophobas morio]|uniref:Uncharacterized protein n=1 Tax=Zophobas morio TaxID=2755281 RepID=A0AA38M048_9CUCU|nr:hypothetical protein Zmor_016455 [Zophobas morio]
MLNEVFNKKEIVNTKFINLLRDYSSTIDSSNGKRDLGLDIVSTGYQKGYSFGSDSLVQRAHLDASQNIYDSYYSVVAPDGVKVKTDLAVLLTNLSLGEIASNNADKILAALNKTNNTNITSGDVSISNITETGATITANSESGYKGLVDVAFTINPDLEPKPLSDFLADNTDLGEIADKSSGTILEAVVANNNEIDTSELTVLNATDTGATIKAKDGSTVYTGQVSVVYTLKIEQIDLNSIITTRELDELDDENTATILAAINSKNAGINLQDSDVTITPNGTHDGATIAAKSSKYTGQVDVTYKIKEVDEPTSLTDIIDPNDLGEIGTMVEGESPTAEELTSILEDKFSLVNGEFEIDGTPTETQATVKAVDGSTVYKDSVTITYKITHEAAPIDISTLIKTRELGPIDNTEDQTIINAINAANVDNGTSFTSSDLEITVKDTNDGATVNGIGDYTGTVEVSFEFEPEDTRTDLSAAIVTKNLTDPLNDNEDATILAAVSAANSGLSLTNTDVEITDKTETSATIKAKDSSEIYKGSASITFTIAATLPNLDSVIGTKDLGTIVDTNDATILAAIKEKNDGLDLTDKVTISVNEGNDGATITPIADSQEYSGSADVKFSVTPQTQDLANVFNKTKIGTIDDKEPATILAAANEANGQDVSIDDVQIDVTSDTETIITPVVDSEKYTGSATVTFALKDTRLELESTFTNRTLIDLENTSDETIIAAINAANADVETPLTTSDVAITLDEENSTASLDASSSTNYKGTMQVTYTLKDTTVPLNTVITGTTVDNIESSTLIPTVDEVSTALLAQYHELNSDEIEIAPQEDSITVTPKAESEIYSGEAITLTPSYVAYDIANIDAVIDPMETFDDATILEELIAKNSQIDLLPKYLTSENVTVTDNEDGTATITVTNGAELRITGTINVTYKTVEEKNYFNFLAEATGQMFNYSDYTMVVVITNKD